MHPCSSSIFRVLADTYSLYLKTQNYHWNVRGPLFRDLHLMFEAQYRALEDRIDVLAELVRTLGDPIDGTFQAFASASCLKPGRFDLPALAMAQELASDQRLVVGSIEQALTVARQHNHEATITVLADTWLFLDKAAWMLDSIAHRD
jgi:starvation-inducible DNA-binding protein